MSWKGRNYLITANEGDAHEYLGDPSTAADDFVEEIRVGSASYVLDPATFPNASDLKKNITGIGRLNVWELGDLDGDGDINRIQAFGARSITVWDDSGKLVWDSGDLLEQEALRLFASNFNQGHTNNTLDDRSDNKGPEPEGLALGQVNGRTYAFVGLKSLVRSRCSTCRTRLLRCS